METRTILHSDLNNFYASVECMLHPELRSYPVAVCGKESERHGVVLAKNYAAKAFGVQTGESVREARAKCPGLITVEPHFHLYSHYAALVRQIYQEYSDQVEPFGMDESFIDVTASARLFGDGETIAQEIRLRVRKETGLTVSVGVSFNKIFAKLGSDMKKPDAVTCITRENFREKVWPLPVGEMLGVGRAAVRELKRFGITTIGALAHCPEELLVHTFGISGVRLKQYANGEDDSAVASLDFRPSVKSVGNGVTFRADLTAETEVWPMILALSDEVARRLREERKKAHGVALFVKCCDLSVKEWQAKLTEPTQNALTIAKRAFLLFRQKYPWVKSVRMLCIRAIRLEEEDAGEQLSLFFPAEEKLRMEAVDRTVDVIRNRYGRNAITSAATLRLEKMPEKIACEGKGEREGWQEKCM